MLISKECRLQIYVAALAWQILDAQLTANVELSHGGDKKQ
jgi:hypothetical protein